MTSPDDAFKARAAALLIGTRDKSLEVRELGMRCDSREIPDLVEDSAAECRHWIAVTEFVGAATFAGTTDEQQVDDANLAALVLGRHRLGGILKAEEGLAALWFAAPTSIIAASVLATGGLIRKKPRILTLQTPLWTIKIAEVDRLLSRNGRMVAAGRAGEFYDALVQRAGTPD